MNEMEVVVFVFLLYYGVKFLFFLLEFTVDFFIIMWGERMSKKNRKIIRHWEWLVTMGYEETSEAILKKMSVK